MLLLILVLLKCEEASRSVHNRELHNNDSERKNKASGDSDTT